MINFTYSRYKIPDIDFNALRLYAGDIVLVNTEHRFGIYKVSMTSTPHKNLIHIVTDDGKVSGYIDIKHCKILCAY